MLISRRDKTFQRRRSLISTQNTLSTINPQTPRTQKACQALAINPEDLIQKSFKDFYDSNIHPDIQQLRFEAHVKNVRYDRERVLKYKRVHIDPIAAINLSIGERAQFGINTLKDCRFSSLENTEEKKFMHTQES